MSAPTPAPAWSRLVAAFFRPFELVWVLSKHPVVWRQYLRTVFVQVGLTFALGTALFTWDEERPKPPEKAHTEKRPLKDLVRRLNAGRDAGLELKDVLKVLAHPPSAHDGGVPQAWAEVPGAHDLEEALNDADSNDSDDDDDEVSAVHDAGVAAETADARDERVRREVWDLIGRESDGGVAPEHIEYTLDAPDGDDAPRPWWWKAIALYVSSLVFAQTVVLAFTRDWHDRIAYDVSLLVALQPEDVPPGARVRLDLKWLWRKFRRRFRGVAMVASGVLPFGPVLLLAAMVGVSSQAWAVVISLVSAYWWVVFTAARSARAWRTEADLTLPAPWQWVQRLVTKFPWLKWVGLGVLMRVSARLVRSMVAPARSIEADVPRFVGLGLARVVATVPLVRIAMRAAIVVASAEALEATSAPEPYDLRERVEAGREPTP